LAAAPGVMHPPTLLLPHAYCSPPALGLPKSCTMHSDWSQGHFYSMCRCANMSPMRNTPAGVSAGCHKLRDPPRRMRSLTAAVEWLVQHIGQVSARTTPVSWSTALQATLELQRLQTSRCTLAPSRATRCSLPVRTASCFSLDSQAMWLGAKGKTLSLDPARVCT
jgi:hypothetical protein